MATERFLIVSAEDFGAGPATNAGIVELARSSRVTLALLMTNSPYASHAVQAWRSAGMPMDLGWQPTLTADRPFLPPSQVASLVDRHGRFFSAGVLLSRWLLGRVRTEHINAELHAQFQTFRDLVGFSPTVIGCRDALELLPPVTDALVDLLQYLRPRPYVHCPGEPTSLIVRTGGHRLRRLFLSWMSGDWRERVKALQCPTANCLIGPWASSRDPRRFTRPLEHVHGRCIELICRPGYIDETLTKRLSASTARPRELQLLTRPDFDHVCHTAGLTRVRPSEFLKRTLQGTRPWRLAS